MWCRECHKEVDVKSANMAGAACPVCGCTLVASSRQTDDIRRAYEILERWQSSDLFERINTTAPLATLKQQDRAPLLNIPLGKKSAPAPPPVEVPVNAASSVFLDALPAPRNRVTLDSLRPPVPSAEQMIWESLIAPRPLLAATAPALNDNSKMSEAVVPPPLASGVSERLPPKSVVPRIIHTEIKSPVQNTSETLVRHHSRSELDDAAIDAVIADAANYETTASLESDETLISRNHQVQLSSRTHTDVEETSANALPDDSLDSVVVDQIELETSFVDDLQNLNADTFEQDDSSSTANNNDLENIELSDLSEPVAVAATGHVENETIPRYAQQILEEVVSVPFVAAVSEPLENETIPAASSDSVKTIAATHSFSTRTPAVSLISAELPQPVLPALMSSTSIHEESAALQYISADSANDAKPQNVNATKKSQRAPMRRPPLHRRFQLEHPVSESSAGSDTVTRKLRLDQTGGNAETPEARESASSVPSSVAPETKIISNSPKPGRRFRVDQAQSIEETTGTAGQRSRTHGLPKQRFIDEAHETQLRGPHFEVTAPRRSNLTSMTGQFLAYLGVLGLTVGTAMVIYGHFGGYSEYTPTGWLVTTVAQMLLFLGVINLVSGGIEQNNEDVSRRINSLGEQLLRIEQVTSEVARGPKLPAHLYAEDNIAAEQSERETVAADRR